MGLVGHLRTAPTVVPPFASSLYSTPPTKSDRSPEPPLPSSSSSCSSFTTPSSYSSSSSSSASSSSPPFSSYSCSSSSSSCCTAPKTAALAAITYINTTPIPDTTADTTHLTSDSRSEDQDYTCPHCDRTFTSHIRLVDHLQIHRTETGEPVPGAPTYTHRTRLHFPHGSRTFTHRMGLFGNMRIHESGIDRPPDSPPRHTPLPLHHPLRPSPISQLTPTLPTSPAHTVHAHSPLTSAWSATCESIALRLANQCMEPQTIPTTLDSTAHTAFALSGIAWAYSATCESTTTYGRQPPATPPHNTLPPCLHHHPTTYEHSLTASSQLPPRTQVGSVHLNSVPMRLWLHGQRESETISALQASWIGRLLIDAPTRFTQFVALCVFCGPADW
nr:unnamed protein product [Spirometra erinaceieuropaei]